MNLYKAIDSSELAKYLNQYDLFNLVQVNHPFYDMFNPYLVKIYDWISRRCAEFMLIYQIGKKTKADDRALNSLEKPYLYTDNLFYGYRSFTVSLFSFFAGSPRTNTVIYSTEIFNIFPTIKNGDVVTVYKLRKGKLKYRISYTYYKNQLNINRTQLTILNSFPLSLFPPTYWKNIFFKGFTRFAVDVNAILSSNYFEFDLPAGCRFHMKNKSKRKNCNWFIKNLVENESYESVKDMNIYINLKHNQVGY